ncbi:hypothetical protein VCHC19A1_2285, partial [Vibrio cholerae HC-19A1]
MAAQPKPQHSNKES